MVNNFTGNFADDRVDANRAGSKLDSRTVELYQSFMSGYVKRINDSTFGVTIGGIRIGSAKYSRLAQINLKSRIITFSRYAIENVPERGRRYLVIHELAHVLEASHNSRFWELVGRHEPNYKAIGQQLDLAFKRNVQEEQLIRSRTFISPSMRLFQANTQKKVVGNGSFDALQLQRQNDNNQAELESERLIMDCMDMDDEYEFGSGTVSGGPGWD